LDRANHLRIPRHRGGHFTATPQLHPNLIVRSA
jgi:hypothetical protein